MMTVQADRRHGARTQIGELTNDETRSPSSDDRVWEKIPVRDPALEKV